MPTLGSMVFWLLMNNKVVGLVSGAVACALIWRTEGRFPGARTLAIGAAIYLALRAAVFLQFYECWDFAVYCQTGRAVVQGTDPYASSLSQYPLNALPLFGLFALLPLREAQALWYGFNLIALVLALRLSQLIVKAPRGNRRASLLVRRRARHAGRPARGRHDLGVDAGQLVVWTTLAIYAGIRALDLGRQVPAGLAFVASSLKITTSLPFLLLPFERRSWRVLVVFGVGVAALSLCLYPPGQLLGMEKNHLANVAAAREVGEINDYSYEGPYHDDMLGLEHWLYCLGMRDAKAISGLQLGILAVIGLGLFWDFRVRARPRDERLLAVLLCLYSCIFLYHRSYDGVILMLPLLYCVVRAREAGQGRAVLYKAMATGCSWCSTSPGEGCCSGSPTGREPAVSPAASSRSSSCPTAPGSCWARWGCFGVSTVLRESKSRGQAAIRGDRYSRGADWARALPKGQSWGVRQRPAFTGFSSI